MSSRKSAKVPGLVLRSDLKIRRRASNPEHKVQAAIVAYHRAAVDHSSAMLFAVPNAGKRRGKTGAVMVAEGLTAGVSDLILVTRGFVDFLEVKLPKAPGQAATHQSAEQLAFEAEVTSLGHNYAIIRSIDDYKAILASRGVRHA